MRLFLIFTTCITMFAATAANAGTVTLTTATPTPFSTFQRTVQHPLNPEESIQVPAFEFYIPTPDEAASAGNLPGYDGLPTGSKLVSADVTGQVRMWITAHIEDVSGYWTEGLTPPPGAFTFYAVWEIVIPSGTYNRANTFAFDFGFPEVLLDSGASGFRDESDSQNTPMTQPVYRLGGVDYLGEMVGGEYWNLAFVSFDPTIPSGASIGIESMYAAGVVHFSYTFETQTTPEPATLAMLGMGLAGLPFARRFRRK